VVAEECISGDCINGYGTYIFGPGEWEGDKYIGENKNNLSHGLGTYYFVSGDKYAGEYKNNKRDGQGTYYYSDGEVEKGIWKNNELVEPN